MAVLGSEVSPASLFRVGELRAKIQPRQLKKVPYSSCLYTALEVPRNRIVTAYPRVLKSKEKSTNHVLGQRSGCKKLDRC